MSSIRCVTVTMLTLVLMAEPGPHRRAFAADEVAPSSLVGESVAVCLEVPRFEATWSKLQSSRLAARLKVFPPVERFLGGAGFQKWTLVEEHVRRTTGNSLSEHLLGAFSESLVVAVYLPEGKPPEGVVIAQARDATALKKALQAWATLDPQHDSQTKEHQGHTYVRRAKSAKSTEVVFHTTFGRTIALSDHERLIHQVIEFHAAANRKDGPADTDTPRVLRDLALYQTNMSRLPVESAALLFINTRQWDRVVHEALRTSPDAVRFQPVFQQVAAMSASLRLDDEVVVTLVADTGGAPAPAGWLRFVAGTNGGGDWGRRIPAEAIAAISSRLEIGALVRAWLTTSPDTKTDDFARGRNLLKSLLLGRDLFEDVLPQVLRDWTISLVPMDAAVADLSPLEMVGRFSLKGNEKLASHHPSLETSLDQALQFGMTLFGAMLSHQRGALGAGTGPVLVESESSAAGTTRTLNGLRPWTPTYTLTPQQLTAATSRRALTSGQTLPRESTSARTSRLADCEKRYFRSTTQLVWVDSARLRSVLEKRSDWIAGQLAPDSPEGRERVRKHLSHFESATKVFDAAFLAARFDEDHVRIIFGAALDRSE